MQPAREMKRKQKIFIVDDHPLVREWLSNLINQQPDLGVCGEAEDAPHALDMIGAEKPDVAIIDITLKGGSGIELIKDVTRLYPAVAVIVLTMHDESLYAERAFRAGARGYVMKRDTTRNVVAAVRRVLEGKVYMSDKISEMMAARMVNGHKPVDALVVDLLSDRELEIFELIGQGWETRRIAEALNLSFKTVQAYCARIKEKLRLDNATELLREAIRWHERATDR